MLSLIIPTKNHGERVKSLLTAMASLPLQDVEVIVCDSSLPPLQLTAYPFPVTVVHCGDRSCPAAINQGVQAAQGEEIMLLADDVVLYPHTIPVARTLLDYCERDGATVGILYHDSWDWPCHVFLVCAEFWIMKKTTFAKVSGYDEGYRHAYADLAFTAEAHQRGVHLVGFSGACLRHFDHHNRDTDQADAERFHQAYPNKIVQIACGDSVIDPRSSILCPQLHPLNVAMTRHIESCFGPEATLARGGVPA